MNKRTSLTIGRRIRNDRSLLDDEGISCRTRWISHRHPNDLLRFLTRLDTLVRANLSFPCTGERFSSSDRPLGRRQEYIYLRTYPPTHPLGCSPQPILEALPHQSASYSRLLAAWIFLRGSFPREDFERRWARAVALPRRKAISFSLPSRLSIERCFRFRRAGRDSPNQSTNHADVFIF